MLHEELPLKKRSRNLVDQIQPTIEYNRTKKTNLIRVICITTCLVVAVALCTFLVPRRKDRIRRLRLQLPQLIARSDFDGAAETLLKLEKLVPEGLNFQFQLAVVEFKQGKEVLSRERITRLIDKGHPEAASWILEKDFNELHSDWDEQKRLQFEKLIALAVGSSDPTTAIRWKKSLAAYQLLHNKLEDALETLSDLSRDDPTSGLNAAVVALKLNQRERATVT